MDFPRPGRFTIFSRFNRLYDKVFDRAMSHHTCQLATFRALFFRYAPEVRRFLFFRTGDWAGSEDAVQEVFLRLWKNCAAVPEEKVPGYLYAVANSLPVGDAGCQDADFRLALAGLTHTNSAETEWPDLCDRLSLALARLPEHHRTVFLMNRVGRLPFAAIADRLGLHEHTVEKRIHTALLELRQCLEIVPG